MIEEDLENNQEENENEVMERALLCKALRK